MPCLTRTPLRLGLAGGGTDIPPFSFEEGGAVVNAALGLYVYVLAKWRHDDSFRVSYTKTEVADSPEGLQHELAREALLLCGIRRGVEIVTVSDIPGAGSGLGSSSAVTVGILHALCQLQGRRVHQEELADMAAHIERDVLRRPIGWQDQYGCAVGGVKLLRIGPGAHVQCHRLRLREEALRRAEESMALYWVSAPPPSATVLQEQVEADRRGLLRRMKQVALRLGHELTGTDPATAIARAVADGWEAKRQLCGAINCPAMEAMSAHALAAGAEAVKLCGAGGGGYMLVCAESRAQEAIAARLGRKPLPVRFDYLGTTILMGGEHAGLAGRAA